MKITKVHYYGSESAFLKSICGKDFSELLDHTNNKNYVTCKICIKKLYES